MPDSDFTIPLTLEGVLSVTEASAFRITPTYLYAFKYKGGNKSLGLVPVHIKHPNVSKHIFDLVDPEPGTPLANTVIGEIPKHYKAASDLVLKDTTKTLKDVLTKDGASDDAELLHHPKSAPALVPPPANAGLGGAQAVPLDTYLGAVGFGVSAAAIMQNTQITSVLLKVYGANWKEKAAALGFAVPGLNPVPPEVANAAKILKFPPGSEEFKALAALHEFGNMVDAVAEVIGEDAFEEVFDKKYMTFEKVIALIKKAKLATANEDDDGNVTVKFKPMAASPMLVPAPTPPVTSVPPPPVTSAPASVAPLSVADQFSAHWKAGAQAKDAPQKLTVGSPPVAPVPLPTSPPAAPPAPAPASPTPTATQTAPITSGGLGLPAIPPLATLSFAGDAKGTLKGYHPKSFLKDGAGNTFLFKPESVSAAAAASAHANIAVKVFGADNAVPVVAGTVAGVGTGSIQPMIPNVKTDLSQVDLTTLTQPQLARLMQERVLDWALASHDTKAANFLLTTDGNVVGIDKDQSLKFLGKDSLDTTYKPNPTPQIYGALFDLFKKKKVDLPVGAMLPAIKKIEAMSDDGWLANFSSYIDAAASTPAQRTKLKKDILVRKKSVRTDLEAFITGVFQARGDIGMTDTFEFESGVVHPKKKKDLSGISTPPMGSILSPASLPALGTLTPGGSAGELGGAGEKFFFTGPDGKYLVKLARSKDKTMIQPTRIAAQEIFSQLSNVVRPGKSIPIADVPGGYKGIPATIQPLLALGKPKDLKGTTPSSLSLSEKKDVAEEHVLDWLTSQHDTHAANLMRRADGTILSVDKEQGFKFFMPNTKWSKTGDQLDVDYHPNAASGENPPFYNGFWKAFADGSMDFDPTQMKDVVDRVEGIKDSDYIALLSKYVEKAELKDDPQQVAAFIDRALTRKKNIRKDFEVFIGGLYAKRLKKKKGTFSFAGGWSDGTSVSASIVPPPAVLTGPQPLKVVDPNQTGKLGMTGVEMVSSSSPPIPPPVAPPTPPGFPDPTPGNQWQVSSAAAMFGPNSPNFYKVKPPKNLADETPDLTSDKVVVKMKGLTPEKLAQAFEKTGVTLASAPVQKDSYTLAVLPKTDWEKAKTSKEMIGIQVPLPTPPAPKNGIASIPKPGQLKNPVLERSITEVDFRKEKMTYGQPVKADGGGVEGQTIMVQRHTDKKGKNFYRYLFKVRAPFLSGSKKIFTGGTPGSFEFTRTSYDPATDSLKWTGPAQGKTDRIGDTSQWKQGDSVLNVANPKDDRWALRGRVWADVYPKEGEDPNEAFKSLLDTAGPKVASTILKPPTEAEARVMKMSALLWSASPQEADGLAESSRTETELTARLNKLGYSKEDIDSIRMEQVGHGTAVPVLPGRHKKILANNPNLAYVAHGFSSPANLVKMLRTGPAGIMARQEIGLQPKGTSTSPDYSPDQNSGGGDYLFLKPVTKSEAGAFEWGQLEVIMDPSELDRLDLFRGNANDPYGNVHETSFVTRKTLESSSTATTAEIVAKQGFSPNKILKIRAGSESMRQDALTALKAAGIQEFNGMPIEDLVVHTPDFYKKQLAPAGY